jgi:hypothetical protein
VEIPLSRHVLSVFLLAAVVGCEPPPPVETAGDPAITIAHPVLNGDEVAMVCRPNPDHDCESPEPTIPPYTEMLEMLVVVDIDHLELTDPYQPDVVDVDGQGHWHAEIEDIAGYQPSFGRSAVLEVPFEELPLGLARLQVSLQDNTHDDLPGDDVVDSAEFTVVRALEDCTALPDDYCPPT